MPGKQTWPAPLSVVSGPDISDCGVGSLLSGGTAFAADSPRLGLYRPGSVDAVPGRESIQERVDWKAICYFPVLLVTVGTVSLSHSADIDLNRNEIGGAV